MLNVLSLFTGVGGIDLGLERAGMRVVGQVELDPYCQQVLARHWPDVPRHDDVHTAAAWWLSQERPRVDLIAGGFPCQPVSLAGRQRGQDDERWLWPAMADVIRQLRPGWLLLENVPGLLSAQSEHRPYRCLCGWAPGWGGLPVPGEVEGLVFTSDRRGDDGQGRATLASVGGGVRRNGPTDPAGDRTVGTSTLLDSHGATGDPLHSAGPSVSEIEARAGAPSDLARRASPAAAQRQHPLGSGSSGTCRVGQVADEGAESEGPHECPACGRDLANVPGLLVRGLGDVLGDLAACGYDAEWDCVPAAAVGAPHRRDRVWIVAYPNGEREQQPEGRVANLGRWAGDRGAAHTADAHRQAGRPEAGQPVTGAGRQPVPGGPAEPGGRHRDVADSDSAGRGPQRRLGWPRPTVERDGWWAAEPDVGRVAHGIPGRVDRLRALGNSVVPQVAEHAGRLITAAHEREVPPC